MNVKRMNKKLNIMAAFILGIVILTGAAFAEVRTLSGYEELKNAVKQTITAQSVHDSYTIKTSFSVKDNNTVIIKSESLEKQDNKNNSSETKSTTVEFGGKPDISYYFDDEKQRIDYSSYDDTWYIYEKNYSIPKDNMYLEPDMNFEDPSAKALEKVFDAGIAALNMQNSILSEKNKDGTTVLGIDLGEGQIHPFINALFSFAFTQTMSFRNSYGVEPSVIDYEGKPVNGDNSVDTVKDQIPFANLEGDVFIKSVSGRVILDENNNIFKAELSAVISGRDKNGETHDFAFEANGEIIDIDSTIVKAPDLKGKKVVYQEDDFYGNTLSKAYLGLYKSDLVRLENDKFVKTGDACLEITEINGDELKAVRYDMIDGNKQNETEITAVIEGPNWASIIGDRETKDLSSVYGSLSFNQNGSITLFDESKGEILFTRMFE